MQLISTVTTPYLPAVDTGFLCECLIVLYCVSNVRSWPQRQRFLALVLALKRLSLVMW